MEEFLPFYLHGAETSGLLSLILQMNTLIMVHGSEGSLVPRITLTEASRAFGQDSRLITVNITELIAYFSEGRQTRLSLTGGRAVYVEETTDQIDRLVRSASVQLSGFSPGISQAA